MHKFEKSTKRNNNERDGGAEVRKNRRWEERKKVR